MTETESIRIENFKQWYIKNKRRYEEAANYVHGKIMTYLQEQKCEVANSCARAKTIDSSYRKAKKMIEKNGKYSLKYIDPQTQIMDFAGVRIIVYLASEMKTITDAIEQLFANSILYDDSENKIDLLGEDKVGYLSIHYVITIDTNEQQYAHLRGIKCEIQVRTILQDAWAQVFHDRLYKGNGDDVGEKGVKRETNLLAGSLELIDNKMDEIVKYYDSKNGNLSKKAYRALLNETITEESLREYCDVLLNGKAEKYYSYNQVKELLLSLKIEKIRELDYCVNDGFIKELSNMNITLTIDRLVRYILLLADYNKLLSTIDQSQNFLIDSSIYDLLNKFVNMQEICKKYTNLIVNERGESVNV
ncbi:MAG: RelA/SpoT domain-containing protein [Lachnoclostridium sp.]|nr:RelA/SpoT domain-containing protein [Lachnospira sp.]MCM1249189.1 RelA/SpoT domain-containing protein [Lachnoclostridium sp.]MCM1536423.1 RelA/SpoT domain-containing protein [Clostridium sp.]